MSHSQNLRVLLESVSTVLFDVDGTLVDSNELHAEAWVKAFNRRGHDVSLNTIKPWIGKGGDKILSELMGIKDDSIEGKEISDLRAKIFKEQFVSRVVAFPKARELVEGFKSRGLKVVIATSAQSDELQSILKNAGLQGLFDEKTSADDAERSKPDPDIIQAALRRSGVQPDEALMIGDTPYDISAAAAAGVRCIGVRSGGWDDQSLGGAALVFAGVGDIFKELNS